MKTVEAYFGSWSFPPLMSPEPPTAQVRIKYTDGSWEEIFSMVLDPRESISVRSERAVARAILEHFFSGPVTDGQVDRLVRWSGHSLCRLTPMDLKPFVQGSLF